MSSRSGQILVGLSLAGALAGAAGSACRANVAPTQKAASSDPDRRQDPEEPAAASPADVFGPWDGVWKGTFRVLNEGDVLTELSVEQRYRSEGPNVQWGRFEERDVETGELVTATATNSVTPDGLRCEVTKSTGETVVHEGRRIEDGGIEWFRKTPDLEEHFFERVRTDGEQTEYTIEGWGRYGRGPRLTFEGRYERVGPEPDSF